MKKHIDWILLLLLVIFPIVRYVNQIPRASMNHVDCNWSPGHIERKWNVINRGQVKHIEKKIRIQNMDSDSKVQL